MREHKKKIWIKKDKTPNDKADTMIVVATMTSVLIPNVPELTLTGSDRQSYNDSTTTWLQEMQRNNSYVPDLNKTANSKSGGYEEGECVKKRRRVTLVRLQLILDLNTVAGPLLIVRRGAIQEALISSRIIVLNQSLREDTQNVQAVPKAKGMALLAIELPKIHHEPSTPLRWH